MSHSTPRFSRVTCLTMRARIASLLLLWTSCHAFVTPPTTPASSTSLSLAPPPPSLEVTSLVTTQEALGLAVCTTGEALWSLSQAPTVSQALRVLGPALVASGILVIAAVPALQDTSNIGTGLTIASVVSLTLLVSYSLRLVSPVSESPKEIAFLGLLLSIAGTASFVQNLVVAGYVTLPTLPSIALPF